MPSYPTAREALNDLADAPYALRSLATCASNEELTFTFPPVGDDQTIGQDDVLRWAAAIDDVLDRTEDYAPWKVWAMACALWAVGGLAGAVSVMVTL